MYFYDGVTIVHEGGVTTKGNDIGEKKSYIAKRNRIFESEMYFYSQYENVNGIVIGLAKLCFSFYLLKLKIDSNINYSVENENYLWIDLLLRSLKENLK